MATYKLSVVMSLNKDELVKIAESLEIEIDRSSSKPIIQQTVTSFLFKNN